MLLGGLALLALVNYLDLVGMLGIGWSNNFVGWLAAVWTIAVGVTLDPGEELAARVSELGYGFLGTLAIAIVAFVASPDTGLTYLLQANPVGQIAYAIAPAVSNGLLVLVCAYLGYHGAVWLAEYLRLRRTTPEDRVLEEDHL
ncbi:hypothetical protein [Halobellus inordinatus]|uniref:hypothetical protein n=1 Tax=Halobellus inordinatus TaxID=1126236 RepID=UPI00210BAF1A|nr:hypothetical protein [Halobellus inordinatus]